VPRDERGNHEREAVVHPFELARRVERTEMAVWADAVRAVTPDIFDRTGLRVVPVADGMAIVAPGIPNLLYNRALGFGLDAPIGERDLDAAIALFRPDQPFAIQPSPIARPAAIPEWLRARGFDSFFEWVIWVRNAESPTPAPADLRITIAQPEHAAVWTELVETIFAEGAELTPWLLALFGRERWTHYLSWDGDRPVGVGALYVDGEVGWLGWGGTLASHRGRGGQSALFARRIEDARAAGCRWLTVETADDLPDRPNPSYRNAERAGFQVLHRRPSFVIPKDS
jgi:hypothetical protein